MTDDWSERHEAELIRQMEERRRQRELELIARASGWARIIQDQRRRAEERTRLRERRNKVCGAKTRAGHPCRRKGLGKGGRCANHGGLSTGPKTEAGRERIRQALKRRWAKWRQSRTVERDSGS